MFQQSGIVVHWFQEKNVILGVQSSQGVRILHTHPIFERISCLLAARAIFCVDRGWGSRLGVSELGQGRPISANEDWVVSIVVSGKHAWKIHIKKLFLNVLLVFILVKCSNEPSSFRAVMVGPSWPKTSQKKGGGKLYRKWWNSVKVLFNFVLSMQYMICFERWKSKFHLGKDMWGVEKEPVRCGPDFWRRNLARKANWRVLNRR